ncbi:Bicarbonate transport ATP-binding protein CmpD [Pseudovibrio axinellae]|uniref:Bicarbonate transport ATP-binding protein CmpD n=1 Tax=Pseudovibrio axinellae TaxID=989403 RepID=A0A166A8A7_9HYPH|nr:ABC transporter ATP-binding protein [Pseudovibrio axinellae]KZL20717.1 Bicarbonate transport ATP-binding protein CmpD [Pseudovibrio axinellae]SER24838.1 NitT/TauT family transport system ATP-binding protein [Pseudovibrio axinellae]
MYGSPLLSLMGISKTFQNGTTALDGLDLDVQAGEFLSILGPSGCGKSTILRLISGLEEQSSGEIVRTGEDDVGFVFQEPTLLPWATVADNVYWPLKVKGVSKRDATERVEEALEMVGLSNFAAHMPSELSGGMKMRVSIARALVTKPKLLLMDEPFAALDEITRNKLNDDLLDLKSKHDWTILFVTHSVYESVFLSSRIVVMAARPGRIVHDMSLEAPFPRSLNYRMESQYASYCREAVEALETAMAHHEKVPA